MYKTKVFFTASYEGKQAYQENYDLIVKAIKESTTEVIATELGNYKTILTQKEMNKCKTEREMHYLAIKRGIQWADLVILELSHESFQVGHEATLALELNKPVLGLSVNVDWSERIIHRYFYGEKYSKYFVKEIVQDFIAKNSKEDLNERFNLFLSKSQLKKLETLSKKENMNKSEYLRNLINH